MKLHCIVEGAEAAQIAAEDAARGADGPGTFHARLYDTLYALTPASLDERANIGDA